MPHAVELLGSASTISSTTLVNDLLKRLDTLLASTVLSLASLLPGPAGYAGAAGAIAFDASWRYWIGVILSGLSMIPVAGYLPAVVKVAILLLLVDRQLGKIEAFLPTIQESPELLARIHEVLGRYAGKLVKFRLAGSVRSKVQRILEQTATRGSETASVDGTKTSD